MTTVWESKVSKTKRETAENRDRIDTRNPAHDMYASYTVVKMWNVPSWKVNTIYEPNTDSILRGNEGRGHNKSVDKMVDVKGIEIPRYVTEQLPSSGS